MEREREESIFFDGKLASVPKALAKRGWVPNTVPSLDGIHNVVTAEIDEAKARVTRKYMTLEQPLAAKKVATTSLCAINPQGSIGRSCKDSKGLQELVSLHPSPSRAKHICLLENKNIKIQVLIRNMNKTHIIKKYHPVTGTMFNQMLNFNRPHNCMADLALPKFLALAKRGWVPNTVPSLDGIHNVVTAEIDEAKARVTRKYMTLEQPLAAKKVATTSS
ncbi:hypothetical protein JHK86_042961 [Glycine max]|nr:hypothetical protein JHK86_042961 [Glycine max]